ncbi:MAG: YicC/YloC family endoribonuclease [Pseudomonadota bacterium]
MPIASMTGFASVSGEWGSEGLRYRWRWDLKSVNARGRDVRLRIPGFADGVEADIRKRVSDRLARGSISVTLQLDREQSGTGAAIDVDLFVALAASAREAAERAGLAPPTADGLMMLRGIVQSDSEQGTGDPLEEALLGALLESFDTALAALIEMRQREGAHLHEVVLDQVSEIEHLTGAIAVLPQRTPDAIGTRLAQQIDDLMARASELDPDRLHQEALLMSQKQDVREEIDRLAAHVAAGRELLAEGGAVGRRLDFLTQELNREANTICSKSGDIELTRIGLSLKAVIDQMREQVQNIE